VQKSCLMAVALLAGAATGEAGDRLAGLTRTIVITEHALNDAVGRVSRPSPTGLFGPAQSARGYWLPNVGVVFVVPPRCVPNPRLAQLRRSIARAAASQRARMGAAEASAMGAAKAGAATPAAPGTPTVKVSASGAAPTLPLEATPPGEEFGWAAAQEQARSAQEQARSAQEVSILMEQEVQRALVEMWQRTPGGPTLDELAPLIASLSAPPWLEGWPLEDQVDNRTPDDVIKGAQEAALKALAGSDWSALPEGECVSVAMEFYDEGLLEPSGPPYRTFVARVTTKDLAAFRAGTLAHDELLRRSSARVY
jgi:hypothetical protein